MCRRPHSRLRSRNLTPQGTELFSSWGFLPHVPKVLWAASLPHDTVRALDSPERTKEKAGPRKREREKGACGDMQCLPQLTET